MSDNLNQLDHEAQAVSRLLTQFRDATTLQGYIKALMSEANPIEMALFDTLTKRGIDTAEGVQLDILGDIVGQSREIVDASALTFFGYVGAPTNVGGYGSARYLSEGESTIGTRDLTDEEYRLFIRARVAKNHSSGTINDTVNLVSFIVGSTNIIVTDGTEPATFSVGVLEDDITANAKIFISQSDLIPKPAGVQIDKLFTFPSTGAFAYAGASGTIAGYNVGQYVDIF